MHADCFIVTARTYARYVHVCTLKWLISLLPTAVVLLTDPRDVTAEANEWAAQSTVMTLLVGTWQVILVLSKEITLYLA